MLRFLLCLHVGARFKKKHECNTINNLQCICKNTTSVTTIIAKIESQFFYNNKQYLGIIR